MYKKYDVKTKIVLEHWLQVKKFLLGYNMKIII